MLLYSTAFMVRIQTCNRDQSDFKICLASPKMSAWNSTWVVSQFILMTYSFERLSALNYCFLVWLPPDRTGPQRTRLGCTNTAKQSTALCQIEAWEGNGGGSDWSLFLLMVSHQKKTNPTPLPRILSEYKHCAHTGRRAHSDTQG